jgi:hypothetical protein
MWTETDDGTSFETALPACCLGPRLHREIDALALGVPYRIEWLEGSLVIHFEGAIDSFSRVTIAEIVASHDATAEIEELAAKKAIEDKLTAESLAIVEEARAKRLTGEPLDLVELAAVVDALLLLKPII